VRIIEGVCLGKHCQFMYDVAGKSDDEVGPCAVYCMCVYINVIVCVHVCVCVCV